MGLPAQREYPANSGIELGPLYDKAGKVISNTDLLGNETDYQYNNLGQLVVTTQPAPQTGAARPVTTDSYDADGELLSESLPDPGSGAAGGPTTTYTYDAFGNQASVTLPATANAPDRADDHDFLRP